MKTCIIGYGNVLRSDDGVGPAVARALADEAGTKVLICHQLTPDLAANLGSYDLVVFVDATSMLPAGAIAVTEVEPTGNANPAQLTHYCEPGVLLLLADRLYGARPHGVLVTIGAASFDHGEGLSPEVEAALPQAVAAIRARLVSS